MRAVHQSRLFEHCVMRGLLLTQLEIVGSINEHLRVVKVEVGEQFKLGAMSLHNFVRLAMLLVDLLTEQARSVLDHVHHKIVMLLLHVGDALVVRHATILLNAHLKLQLK